MKVMKYLLGAALASAFVTTASAQCTPDLTLYVTGSTAFRAEVWLSICSKLSGTACYANSGGATGASQMTWLGTWPHDGSALQDKKIKIYTAYNGSAAGVNAVCASTQVQFVELDGTTQVSHVADAAFSDAFQESICTGNCGLTDNQVGVITFVFAKNIHASAANIANVTSQNMLSLYDDGLISLAQLTGNNADAGTTVYATGRDGGSGTRIISLAEPGFGVCNPVQQYHAHDFTGTTTKTQTGPINWTAFANNDGWTGGGQVKADLLIAANGPGIGYVGYNDRPSDAQVLTYNGYPLTIANVQEGRYTLWSYEHLYSKTVNGNSFASSIIPALNALLTGGPFTCSGQSYTPGPAAIAVGSMNCLRFADGAQVIHF